MKRGARPEAMDLVEEAVRLLKGQPVMTWVCHLAGTLPFVVALWFFWSDMSRGVGARERCVSSALWLALAFGWMKAWQLEFVRRLRGTVTGRLGEAWTMGQWLRSVAVQWAVQPWQIVLLPLAAVLVVPFGWVLAFFENVMVLGAEPGARLGRVCRRSLGQTWLWPAQNHAIVFVLLLVGLAIMGNVVAVLGWVPSLLKSFLGLETAFTRSQWALLNTTFLAVCGGLTLAMLDPLLKAVYVLRCFHGESVRTGEDLRSALRRVPAMGAIILASVIMAGIISGEAQAAEAPDRVGIERATQEPQARALDQAITEVMGHPVYEWRFPREKAQVPSERGFVGRALDRMLDWVRETGRKVGQWMERPVKWLGEVMEAIGRKVFGRGWRPPMPGGGLDVVGGLQLLMWLLLTLLVAAAGVVLYRAWRRRGRVMAATVEAGVVRPDLRAEEVTAAELPEDEWLRLAEEMFGQGEGRLGLRALYLAMLARLARQGWIRVARHKSNRDYLGEASRRGREWPEALRAVGESVRLFEASWYGEHEVTEGVIVRFRENLEVLRSCDSAP